MNKLFFDIETLPADESFADKLKYLFGRKKKKRASAESEDFEGFADKTGLDGAFGRILVISYAVNDSEVKSICNPADERKTLEEFWDIAATADLFIGHNIMDFDLRFIYQRSVILGVRPTKDMKFFFVRYKSDPVYDTMKEWTKWGDSRSNKSLEYLAVAMGLPTPKEGIDGSEVNNFFKAGKVKEICEYCCRDVETVRAVYKRMTFESLPVRETLPF